MFSKSIIKLGVIFFFAIGFLGAVFFFPVNINNQYTCLYHRLTSTKSHHPRNSNQTKESMEMMRENQNNLIHSQQSDVNENDKTYADESDALGHYVIPFGFLWWGSLMIIAFSIFELRKLLSLQHQNFR